MDTPDWLHRYGIIGNQRASLADGTLIILLALVPFLCLTVRSAFGLDGLLILLLCLFLLWREPALGQKIAGLDHARLMMMAFVLPILCILISEAIRSDFKIQNYDGPSRLLLAIPIFLAIFVRRVNYWKLFSTVLPLALVATWVYAGMDKLNAERFGTRLSTHYLDPILWGNFAVIHGFICLFSMRPDDSRARKCYLYAGLGIGAVMSLLSQSRGGWVAALAMFCFWLWIKRKTFKRHQVAWACLALVTLPVLLYFSVDIVHMRVNEAIQEYASWAAAKQMDTSTGLRLSMWKLSFQLFQLQPFVGYGDHGLLTALRDPRLYLFADPEAVKLLQNAGPHNELLAEMLRSGVFGLLSYAAKYLMPFYVFWKLYRRSGNNNPAALQGMCLIIGCMTGGLFIEMLSYKIVYTYYAITIAALMGSAMLIAAPVPANVAAS